MPRKTNWTVTFSNQAQKQQKNLPKKITALFHALIADLEDNGPEARSWKNYGKIVSKKNLYHCHLKTGRPTYVAVWKWDSEKIQVLEIRYVGTHEGIDYKRIE